VAIERPDGPVVEALLGAGFDVVVVASRSVKALRERYGLAGNKSDSRDAYVLADSLRTDGHRWRSLEPDSPATVTLRTTVRARRDLVETRVALANQLRAHLRVVFLAPWACSKTSTARSACVSWNASLRPLRRPGCPRSASRHG
jgi:transposase